MKQTERPLWKKSILQNLTHSDICQYLYEISENGDMYGYDAGETGCINLCSTNCLPVRTHFWRH